MGPGRTQPVSTTPSCPVVLGLSQASLESGAVRLAPLNQQGGRAGGGGGCEEEESAGAWASHVIIQRCLQPERCFTRRRGR